MADNRQCGRTRDDVRAKSSLNKGVSIRAANTNDAASVADIYNHYVRTSIVTFEEEPVTAEEMSSRIAMVQSTPLPWLLAESGDQFCGYAYATRWKDRSAYRFSVEATVYVTPELAGRGIGSILYGHLIPMLQGLGVHAVFGGIALPNESSVALHEKFGFEKVAHLREVGFKFDRWIDVGYWQRLL